MYALSQIQTIVTGSASLARYNMDSQSGHTFLPMSVNCDLSRRVWLRWMCNRAHQPIRHYIHRTFTAEMEVSSALLLAVVDNGGRSWLLAFGLNTTAGAAQLFWTLRVPHDSIVTGTHEPHPLSSLLRPYFILTVLFLHRPACTFGWWSMHCV